MARLIDADKLQKSLEEKKWVIGGFYEWLSYWIDKAPAVDVTEVVRCKDCVWWDADEDDPPWGKCCRPLGDSRITDAAEDDYCSYGERKEYNGRTKAN